MPDLVLNTLKPAGGIATKSVLFDRVDLVPAHPNSAMLTASLLAQMPSTLYGGVAALNVWSYNTAFYEAPYNAPKMRVEFRDEQRKGYVPSELYDPAKGGHFLDVPIMPGMVGASGTDGMLNIWDPDTNALHELWKYRNDNGVPSAVWGGRIDNYHLSRTASFPGYTGVSASGLAYVDLCVGVREMALALRTNGALPHAVGIGVTACAGGLGMQSWPATRNDGNIKTMDLNLLWEGMRMRLPSYLQIENLKIHPIAKVLARTAQQVGFIIVDRADCVSIGTESGAHVADLPYGGGMNPWPAMLGAARGYNVLKGFPWALMEFLPINWGRAAI